MFDISFSELMIVAIVALVVIGPEKLPKVARTVGAFTGRLQRYMAQVKEEVNREMRFDELQKLQQEIQAQTTAVQSEVETAFQQHAEEIKDELEVVAPIKRRARKLSQFNKMPDKPEILPLNFEEPLPAVDQAMDVKEVRPKKPRKPKATV